MDLFSNLTDDQLALWGCLAAFVVSAMVMSLSYYIGPASKSSTAIRTLPHVERLKRDAAAEEDRQAA